MDMWILYKLIYFSLYTVYVLNKVYFYFDIFVYNMEELTYIYWTVDDYHLKKKAVKRLLHCRPYRLSVDCYP